MGVLSFLSEYQRNRGFLKYFGNINWLKKFSIVITDKGEGFNFQEIDIPQMEEYLAELRVGGLGIYLMKTLMDEVDYKKTNSKNQVRMVKYLFGKDKKSKNK